MWFSKKTIADDQTAREKAGRPSCPLCGGAGSAPAFPYATRWNGKEFRFISCASCRTTFVDPLPVESDFALLYSKERYHDLHYPELDLKNAKRSLARVSPLCQGRRSLLDFGCGNGSFLLAAKEAGLRCRGVEYDVKAQENAARNSGAPVSGLSELILSGEKFDIIHLGDVLEHLAEPRTLMASLQELLAPEGLFFVEGPLQRNSSLVYWCAALSKSLRRRIGIDRVGGAAPTHLWLTDRVAQRRFFTGVFGYRCLLFEVYETGWPYFTPGDRTWRGNNWLKHLLGLGAIALSRLEWRDEKALGNRFLGVFQPGPASGKAPKE